MSAMQKVGRRPTRTRSRVTTDVKSGSRKSRMNSNNLKVKALLIRAIYKKENRRLKGLEVRKRKEMTKLVLLRTFLVSKLMMM